MAVVLLLTTLDKPTIEYPVLGTFTIGRSSSCDVVVDDKQMSGKHGEFSLTAKGQLLFKDLGSTNGSFLNNSRIQHTFLRVYESLKIGNTIITINESKLNARERIAIGAGANHEDAQKLTVPKMNLDTNVKNESADQNKAKGKKTVVLNKDLKKKKVNWMGAGKENVLDADESSGKTKFLKIDNTKAKKK